MDYVILILCLQIIDIIIVTKTSIWGLKIFLNDVILITYDFEILALGPISLRLPWQVILVATI